MWHLPKIINGILIIDIDNTILIIKRLNKILQQWTMYDNDNNNEKQMDGQSFFSTFLQKKNSSLAY